MCTKHFIWYTAKQKKKLCCWHWTEFKHYGEYSSKISVQKNAREFFVACLVQNTDREAKRAEMTISTEKEGVWGWDDRQPEEMRDRAVKYLWSTPKEILWERRNRQKNRKWESGSMLWLCALCVAGTVFVSVHAVISRYQQDRASRPTEERLRNSVEGADGPDAINLSSCPPIGEGQITAQAKQYMLSVMPLIYSIRWCACFFFPSHYPLGGNTVITHWKQLFLWPAAQMRP